ncbi:ROK family protein [Microbacterium sp.]|uniref:ROK family protein n=1 Tax=Microbacterium sp. TaxID=51671 RepID=UPI003A8F4A54
MAKISADLGTGRGSVGLVLDLAWGHGVFTASDAMAASGLTRSTTIDALDTLVAAGVLRELPNARDAGEYRAGRPARRFELPTDLGAVIGIDSGDSHLTVTVADLAGSVLASARRALGAQQTPQERRDDIVDAVRSTLASAGIDRKDVLALCAGVAAPVARDGSSPPHPEGFWERTNPGLVDALADWAQVVQIKNDAQLAAAAEGAAGEAIGCRDYIALLAGERLGAGVVVDGLLLHGAHGGVGEMFAFDYVRDVDSAFGLGAAAEELAQRLLRSGEADPDGALAKLRPEQVDGGHIMALAAAQDPDALRVANRLGERLARIVGVLGSMFDPQRVIICGAVAEGIGPVLDATREALAPLLHLPRPELIASQLGGDIVTQGALATALQSARGTALPRLAQERLREM